MLSSLFVAIAIVPVAAVLADVLFKIAVRCKNLGVELGLVLFLFLAISIAPLFWAVL